MYDACVSSILDYDSEVWGLKNINVCELVPNRAIRYFISVHKFTPISAIQADFDWLRCKERRKVNAIRFWNRLINMDDNRLTKKCFIKNFQYELLWATAMENVMEDLGFIKILLIKDALI